MCVSYLLDKNTRMYSNSVGHPTQTLNSQNFMQYTDLTGYHHVTGISDPHAQMTGVWNPTYFAAPQEEWSPYGQSADFHGLSPGTEQISFSSRDPTSILPTGPGTLPSLNSPAGQYSPDSDWIRHNVHSSSTGGKTRTKDKYRVVYTDQQRLVLEKAFQYSRYITIRRKTELALGLSLSERQVKIWFQNRRAKERKITKKKIEMSQQASKTTTTLTLTPSSLADPSNGSMATSSSSSSLLSETISMTIKEEY
ncbi:homeobox protein CDX-1-like [Coregonus clupeaformis]|uniref:homeobox protein CDX-1-like n=1 Tax=Coregonus clupeaformis TaxID=59861 RepID=UPI001BE06677|nr:homeobox protein CDX-1-like [Coregonus clupeaformis]